LVLDEHIHERPQLIVTEPVRDLKRQVDFPAAPVVQRKLAFEQAAALAVKRADHTLPAHREDSFKTSPNKNLANSVTVAGSTEQESTRPMAGRPDGRQRSIGPLNHPRQRRAAVKELAHVPIHEQTVFEPEEAG